MKNSNGKISNEEWQGNVSRSKSASNSSVFQNHYMFARSQPAVSATFMENSSQSVENCL
jgi:hypothetical protein